MATKQRLDLLMIDRGLAPSRARARGMIMAGEVSVDGKMIDKPGAPIQLDAEVTVKEKARFVSRGGEKLAWALSVFKLDIAGRIAADVGASTGGFTDCLLKNGITRVYAIDVGYGQLDYTLRIDERVVVMERTNARHLQKLEEAVDLVVVDASFISLRLLLPAIAGWLATQADIIALIKPQFEAGKQDVGKGGVVRDETVHRRVLIDILTFAQETNFSVAGLTTSPIKGPAGNIEFLAWLRWGSPNQPQDIEALVNHEINAY